jgi:hypothetical protein
MSAWDSPSSSGRYAFWAPFCLIQPMYPQAWYRISDIEQVLREKKPFILR